MKSITTCPSCQTQFLVTDEQLSQYNGKVRYGHCLVVFNAVDYINVQPVESPQAAHVTEQITENEAEISKEQHDYSQFTTITPSINIQHADKSPSFIEDSSSVISIEEDKTSADNLQTETTEIISTDESQINFSDSIADIAKPEIHSADVLKELFSQAEFPLEEVLDDTRKQVDAAYQTNTPIETDLNPELYQEEVSKINEFDYKPEYQYFLDQKKSTSPVLVTLGVFFVFLALLQLLFFFRHSIAMQYPEVKPYFVSICKQFGCTINLPKEIHLFSIDDSTISEDTEHQGVIRLTSTITNRANFNQAYPNLEVTLTDTQDKPKLRRIFKPNEYINKPVNLDEGLVAGDAIEVDMPLMADDYKASGFRLLLSY